MRLRFEPAELQPVLRRSYGVAALFAGAGALAQVPIVVLGFGPVLWSNLLGLGALALGLWLGRQTWRRMQAGPRLDVVLEGNKLSTQWAGEAIEAISLGPQAQVSERMGWLTVQSGGGGVAIPLASAAVQELKEAMGRARFGDRPKALRRQDPLPPANDPVTPHPGLERAARILAFASLAGLGLTVAGGLLIGFDAGLPLFGLFLACAGGFLFVEKGLVPLKTKRLVENNPYSGQVETRGAVAQFSAVLNLVGSALLSLLGVLLLIIGLSALLS